MYSTETYKHSTFDRTATPWRHRARAARTHARTHTRRTRALTQVGYGEGDDVDDSGVRPRGMPCEHGCQGPALRVLARIVHEAIARLAALTNSARSGGGA
jgi:hypothetical protein